MKDEEGNAIKGARISVKGIRHDITTGKKHQLLADFSQMYSCFLWCYISKNYDSFGFCCQRDTFCSVKRHSRHLVQQKLKFTHFYPVFVSQKHSINYSFYPPLFCIYILCAEKLQTFICATSCCKRMKKHCYLPDNCTSCHFLNVKWFSCQHQKLDDKKKNLSFLKKL